MRNDIKRFAVKVCETTKMIRYVAAAIAVLFSLQTSAAVYLKAAAEGEERAVQNGESWATAYTDAQTALTAALAWANAPCFCSAEPLGIARFITNCT
jgi:hypothetical protein